MYGLSDQIKSGYRGAREMKARWIIFGTSALWWIPCLIAFCGDKKPILLGLPVMGFYPWHTEDSAFSATTGYCWEILSLAVFGLLATIAIRRNSIFLSTMFAVLLSLSSVLVLFRGWLVYFD
jgi:hypothetical protein